MQFWDLESQTYRFCYDRRIDEFLTGRENDQVMVEGFEGLWWGRFEGMDVIRMAAAGRRDEDGDGE